MCGNRKVKFASNCIGSKRVRRGGGRKCVAQRVGGSGTQRQRHGAVPGGHSGGWRGGIRRGRRGDESRRDSGCGRRAAVSGVRGGLVPSCLWLRAAPHGAGLEEEGRPHTACRAGGGEGRPLQSGRSSKHALGLPTWGARCPQSHRRTPPSVSRISGGSRSAEWCGAEGAEGDLTAP